MGSISWPASPRSSVVAQKARVVGRRREHCVRSGHRPLTPRPATRPTSISACCIGFTTATPDFAEARRCNLPVLHGRQQPDAHP